MTLSFISESQGVGFSAEVGQRLSGHWLTSLQTLRAPARQQLWHGITGFLEAGKVLSNVASEELQGIIDEEHITAFGITREAIQLKQKLAKTDDEQDWDKCDVPPKMRWRIK